MDILMLIGMFVVFYVVGCLGPNKTDVFWGAIGYSVLFWLTLFLLLIGNGKVTDNQLTGLVTGFCIWIFYRGYKRHKTFYHTY